MKTCSASPPTSLSGCDLPGMAQSLADLLKQAKHNNETTLETISKLADAEKASRIKSAVNRRYAKGG